MEGIWKNRRCRGYLKVQRQAGAGVAREAEWLTKVPSANLPEVLEWSAEPVCWLLTKEAPGERLSTILGSNKDLRPWIICHGTALNWRHCTVWI